MRRSWLGNWAVRRQWLAARLEPRQRALWQVFLGVVVLGLAALAVVGGRVAGSLREFHQAGRRDRIGLPPPAPPAAVAAVTRPAATPAPPVPAAVAAGDAPVLDWHTTARRRRAAAVLAAQGDLEGALALLGRSAADTAAVRQIGEAAFGNLRQHFAPTVREELAALRAFWQGLPPAARARYFPLGEPDRARPVDALMVPAPPGAALRAWAAVLPSSLWYGLQGNLHVALAAASGCPPGVVELALDLEVPDASLAKQLYWRRKPPARVAPADFAAAFAAALQDELVWPRAREFLAAEQAAAAALEGEDAAWYARFVGEPFRTALERYVPERATAPAALEVWRQLPPAVRRWWAEQLLRESLAGSRAALAPAELAGCPWLAGVDDPPDGAALAVAVRAHPLWQQPLRRFDHAAAQRNLPAILRQCHASRQLGLATRLVSTALNFERGELLKTDFKWSALAQALDALEVEPPGIVAQRGGNARVVQRPAALAKGQSWADLAPAKVYQGLRQFAEKQGSERERYLFIAQNYAVNRGLPVRQD